jgi:hypothetical protein
MLKQRVSYVYAYNNFPRSFNLVLVQHKDGSWQDVGRHVDCGKPDANIIKRFSLSLILKKA